VAFSSGSIASFAVAAALGLVFRVISKVKKSIVVFARDQNDIPATAPVTSTGTASGNVFFATECEAAIAAVTGLYLDDNFIDKHAKNKRPPANRAALIKVGSTLRIDLVVPYADEPAHSAAVPEFNNSADACVESVIFASAHVFSGLVLGSPLPDQDRASGYDLAAKLFHSKPLCVRIPPVLRAA
jgi:hypothetical protein